MKKIILMFLVILIIYSLRSFTHNVSRENYLASIDYEDQIATSVGYLTIGWTVKMYDLPIDNPMNATFRCNLEKKYYVDENGVVHTNFVFNEEELLGKIQEKSPQWAERLRRDGGSVYLDAVMTCTIFKDGKHNSLGSMDSAGNLTGETYTTYEGIANARNWPNKEFFRNRYDIEVIYKPVENYSEPPQYYEEVIENEYTRYMGCDENGVFQSGLIPESEEYDLDRAIPSGENFVWKSAGIYAAHKLNYVQTQITAYYPVKVNVTQTLSWTDGRGNPRNEEVSYSEWYVIPRSVTYCIIKNGVIYVPDKVTITGKGMAPVEKSFDTEQIFIAWRFDDIQYPQYNSEINVDAGTVYSNNNLRPELKREDYSRLAEEEVGEFTGQSQYLMIDKSMVLNKDGYKYADILKNIPIEGEAEILDTALNGSMNLEANITYQEYYITTAEGKHGFRKAKRQYGLNSTTLNVWTPVVLKGTYVDNRSENQMLSPDDSRVELVLGEEFKVGVNLAGTHLEQYRGYGYRDYSGYVDKVEVKFSFPVIDSGKIIEPDTWLSPGKYNLPEYLSEGEGKITIRAKAVNYYDGADLGYGCNSSRQEYGAYVILDAELSGQIKNFNSDSMPYEQKTLKKGETFKYNFTTIGLADEASNIEIVPEFYAIDGGIRRRLDLYMKNQNGYHKLDCFEDFGRIVLADSLGGVSHFSGSFLIPSDVAAVDYGFDLPGYVASKIVFNDDECFYRGRVVVNFDISTIKTHNQNLQPLSYANIANAGRGYCNRWQREGFVPKGLWAYGDVAVYNLGSNKNQQYVIIGTH